jgi:hypothetical protein
MNNARLHQALSYLLRRQHKNGGWSSASVFPTVLILSCLAECRVDADTSTAVARAGKFLLSQKSSAWSWNYAVRGSRAARNMRYPDDLDDTSCALLALCQCGELAPDGLLMARFVEHLITAETVPGGPYRTWIMPSGPNGTAPAAWSDVDTAVNANIASFLALQDASVPGLSAYLDQAALTGSYSSLYYSDPAVIRYFLARFFALREDCDTDSAKKARTALVQTLRTDATNDSTLTPLQAALTVTSLLRLGEDPGSPIIRRAVKCIRRSQNADGSWPACPLYIEEIRQGRTTYMESSELTTAFCIEALYVLDRAWRAKNTSTKHSNKLLYERIRTRADTLFSDGPFVADAQKQIARLDEGNMTEMIALFSAEFARAADIAISDECLTALGCANLLGWIGYTVQDDIMDEGKNRNLLPFSNFCVRESYRTFSQYLDEQTVRAIFNCIDTANAWESRYCPVLNNAAPNYGNLSVLGEKSVGHALGPLAILAKAGYAPDSDTFRAVKAFFIQYLLIRQLNDDAHDWEQDLFEGRVNAAIAPIWTPEKTIDELKDEFWNEHIETICADIFKHAEAAVELFEISEIAPTNDYAESLVAPLMHSAHRALSERTKTLEFLKAYQQDRVI